MGGKIRHNGNSNGMEIRYNGTENCNQPFLHEMGLEKRFRSTDSAVRREISLRIFLDGLQIKKKMKTIRSNQNRYKIIKID